MEGEPRRTQWHPMDLEDRGLFQTRNKNASLRILDVKVTLIRPDVALAHVTNELSGVVTRESFHNTLLQP